MWLLFRVCFFLIGFASTKFRFRKNNYVSVTSSGLRYTLNEIKSKGQITGWELEVECPPLPDYAAKDRAPYLRTCQRAL